MGYWRYLDEKNQQGKEGRETGSKEGEERMVAFMAGEICGKEVRRLLDVGKVHEGAGFGGKKGSPRESQGSRGQRLVNNFRLKQ